MPHLLDQMLQLDVARMDQGDLEAMDVQVGQPGPCEDARRAVMVGVDVGDDQAAQATRPEVLQRLADRGQRILRVHAAVEKVGLGAVGEEEHVDQAVFEGNGKSKLEDT